MTATDGRDGAAFQYSVNGDGVVTIFWYDRPVTTLRGQVASRFLIRVEALDERAAQLAMARVTGNFKRGNERTAKSRERRRA